MDQIPPAERVSNSPRSGESKQANPHPGGKERGSEKTKSAPRTDSYQKGSRTRRTPHSGCLVSLALFSIALLLVINI